MGRKKMQIKGDRGTFRSESSDDDDEDEGSSISGDGEFDEEKMYQQIVAAQSQGPSQGTNVDDLVDKDMIDLLKVCA